MSTKAPPGDRLEFVDGMRGLAVLFMFVLHTAHGWLQPQARQSAGWAWITGFGGMAAPLFFLLAGAGVGLQWRAGGAARTGASLASLVARGLSLVVLGYALRVQMWLIDGGAISQPWKWPAAGALIASYTLAYLGCERMGAGRTGVATRLLAAAALFTAGLWGVAQVEPGKLQGLLRVDVLQGIGASLVLLHLLTGRMPSAWARAGLAAALGGAVALATQAAREKLPGALPPAMAAYVAQWPTGAGERPAAMFPMLPWAAYTALGAGLGVYWADAQARSQLGARVAAMTVLGVGLSLATRESSPTVYALMAEHPIIVHPVRVAYRVGICLALSGVAMVLCHRRSPLRVPLRSLGAASLIVYWVHLEFAFGAAATPIRRGLDYGQWWLGLVILTLAMGCVAWLRGWLRRRLRGRRRAPAKPG